MLTILFSQIYLLKYQNKTFRKLAIIMSSNEHYGAYIHIYICKCSKSTTEDSTTREVNYQNDQG